MNSCRLNRLECWSSTDHVDVLRSLKRLQISLTGIFVKFFCFGSQKSQKINPCVKLSENACKNVRKAGLLHGHEEPTRTNLGHTCLLNFNFFSTFLGHSNIHQLEILKGSPDQSHFIFEINVGKSRIRHKTTSKIEDFT